MKNYTNVISHDEILYKKNEPLKITIKICPKKRLVT